MADRCNVLHDQLRRLGDELELAGMTALSIDRDDLAAALAELAQAVDNLRRLEFPRDELLA